MKNNVTELVFILDRSGSMSGLETDTIGGFNSMLKKQQEHDGKCYVSTFLFDNQTEILHDRVLLSDIDKMTAKDYVVRGCTALFDALGEAITHIGKIHKYARSKDVPDQTIFVITTYGMENASRKYDSETIKEMIERKKEKYGWEFLFLAANIDAVESAKEFGIDKNRAVNYHADAKGTTCLYETISDAVCNIRQGCDIDDGWSEKLDEDYKSRK